MIPGELPPLSPMVGSNGEPFTLEQLRHQTNVARHDNISLIVISDACFQGLTLQMAQSETTNYRQHRLSASSLPAAANLCRH